MLLIDPKQPTQPTQPAAVLPEQLSETALENLLGTLHCEPHCSDLDVEILAAVVGGVITGVVGTVATIDTAGWRLHGFPARGDEPKIAQNVEVDNNCSPHARG